MSEGIMAQFALVAIVVDFINNSCLVSILQPVGRVFNCLFQLSSQPVLKYGPMSPAHARKDYSSQNLHSKNTENKKGYDDEAAILITVKRGVKNSFPESNQVKLQ